jgi:flagella basal body P-ring formation protein FlgA
MLTAVPAAAETLVATRTIRAQAIIEPQDLTFAAVATPGALDDPSDVVGMEARVVLYAGRPIRPGDIGAPAIVERNQIVALVFRHGTLTIAAEGRALASRRGRRHGPRDEPRVAQHRHRDRRPDGSVPSPAACPPPHPEGYRPMRSLPLFLLLALPLACGRLQDVGKAPDFNALEGSNQHHAMYSAQLPNSVDRRRGTDQASLWSASQRSLLGDRRAAQRGDILTVVIQIDERAEISNSSGRSRTGSESMGVPNLLGIPQRIDRNLPDGANMANAVGTNSSSNYRGDGSSAGARR